MIIVVCQSISFETMRMEYLNFFFGGLFGFVLLEHCNPQVHMIGSCLIDDGFSFNFEKSSFRQQSAVPNVLFGSDATCSVTRLLAIRGEEIITVVSIVRVLQCCQNYNSD